MQNLRKKEGLTQKELAERTNITQSYISKLESGHISGLTIEKIFIISKVLNVHPCFLFITITKIPCNCIKNCLTVCEQ